jgi:hypothetical protein
MSSLQKRPFVFHALLLLFHRSDSRSSSPSVFSPSLPRLSVFVEDLYQRAHLQKSSTVLARRKKERKKKKKKRRRRRRRSGTNPKERQESSKARKSSVSE